MKNLPALWSKDYNCFFTISSMYFPLGSLSGKDVTVKENDEWFSSEDILLFDDTELKDIDGKSIYAESSIFEFSCKIWGSSLYPSKGYLKHNPIAARYNIHAFGHNGIKIISYDIDYISHIKIIDTIQERDAREALKDS